MNPKAVIAAYKTDIKPEIKIKSEPISDEDSLSQKSCGYNIVARPSISSFQDEFNKAIENLLYIEVKNEFLRRSDYLPYDETLTLYDILNEPTTFKDTEKFKLVQEWPRYQIHESDISPKELIKLGYKVWFFLDLLLSVDYLKTFQLFRELPEKDQYYLCRDVGCTSAYLSRSYYAYNMGAEIVMYPDGTYPFITNSNLNETEKVLRAGKVQDFNALKPDRIHYCLMKALMSFNTYCPLISPTSRKLIEKERSKFVKILLYYLHDKYGIGEGNRKFMESLSIINEIVKMKKNYTDTYHTFKHYFKIGRPDPMLLFDLLNINDSI